MTLIIRNDPLIPLGHDSLPFGFEPHLQSLDASGKFWIQLAAGLQRSPVWRDLLCPFSLGLVGRMSRDPREDTATHRTGH